MSGNLEIWGLATFCALCFHLKLDAGLGHRSERRRLPVGLLGLLPHHHVEGGRILVAKDEAGVVVVSHRVHVKRPLEVHSAESSVTWIESVKSILCVDILVTDIQLREEGNLTNSKSWIAIHGLNNFHSLGEKDGESCE